MDRLDEEVIGIHQVNSIDFIKSAFQIYNSGHVLAILKGSDSGLKLKQEITPQSGGGWLDVKQPIIQEDRPAQIVFTSGTESAPKAILLSHQALADVVTRLNSIMKVDASIREYVGIPVTYSFGFGRCRAVAAAGGKCFIPENGFNPTEIARMLEADEINAISAVPTLWRALLSQAEVIGEHGKKVKWIEIGSQYMSREEKEKMKALFPNAIIIQHYGLTEASRSTFLNVSETEGHLLESVGQTVGNVEIQLSSEGRIMIRGPHVAMGQLINGEIKKLVDADAWFTTGDFGYMEGNHLYYGGRADDLINCGGIKVNPDSLQEKINRRLNIENKIAVCRINDEFRGDGFFVAIEENTGINASKVVDTTMDELLALGVNARSSIKVQEVASLPRTDTGKIQRKELAKLFSDSSPNINIKVKPAKDCSVHELFSRIFLNTKIKATDTFTSLGGDSLNYVQMVMLLEEKFGSAPANWDNMSIKQLENIKQSNTSNSIGWVDTSIFLRFIAILGVVAIHSGDKALGGATWLLFILIGYNLARFKANDLISSNIWSWIGTFSLITLIPYYCLVAFHQIWNHNFDINRILLYENLIKANITLLFPFWFVQVLLQCLILFGIIFSIPALRHRASTTPFNFALILLFIFLAIRAAYPFFWETRHLNDLVPPRFMVLIWLGWSFYYVSETWQRILLCASGIGLAFLDENFMSINLWIAIGSIFLAFVPHVPVPNIARKLVNSVGAATFYIFISNGFIIMAIHYALHIEYTTAVFFMTMIAAMSLWWIMEYLNVISRLKAMAINTG
jgi:acyl-CoA synthetase (AMP-forming)/AMP-acid ligase II/acyl carrier protein